MYTEGYDTEMAFTQIQINIDYLSIIKLSRKYATENFWESISNQLLKLQEEVGESAAAFIGITGQNPRKGVTHSYEDLANELVDVIVTALVVYRTAYGADQDVHLAQRIQWVINRGLAS